MLLVQRGARLADVGRGGVGRRVFRPALRSWRGLICCQEWPDKPPGDLCQLPVGYSRCEPSGFVQRL